MSRRSTETAAPPGSALGRRRLLALLGLGVAGTLAGCGKKGPLRPAEPASPEAPTSPDPAGDEETE